MFIVFFWICFLISPQCSFISKYEKQGYELGTVMERLASSICSVYIPYLRSGKCVVCVYLLQLHSPRKVAIVFIIVTQVSVALIKCHAQKQQSHVTVTVSSLRAGRAGAGQGLGGRKGLWCGPAYWAAPHCLLSLCPYIPWTTCQGWHQPQWAGLLYVSHQT